MSPARFRLAGIASAFVASAWSSAAVIYVNAAAPAGGNGASWAAARNDLQSALAAAQSGDELWVAQGVYKPHPTDRAVSFVLKTGVALYGGFTGVEESILQRNPANTSTLSGEINTASTSDNSYHVVRAEYVDATAVLDGFLITSGMATDTLAYDRARGGGIYIDASFVGCPTIRGCTFSNNAAIYSGGAVYIIGGAVRLERCFFFGNRITGSTGVGGAIGLGVAVSADLTLANCVFSQNFTLAAAGGGAINANTDATVSVYSSTFYNNSAPLGSVLSGLPAIAKFRNCIFSGQGGAAAYFSTPVNVQYSVVPGGMTGAGNINANATFVNAAGANYRLASGSAGINAGSNTALPPGGLPRDFDLNPRILDGVIDAGAYEFIAHTCAGDLNKDGNVDDADFVIFVGAYNNLVDRGGDLNNDLFTDDADFVIFVGAYDLLICP